MTVLLGIATRIRLARLLLITGLLDGDDELAGFVGATLGEPFAARASRLSLWSPFFPTIPFPRSSAPR